MHRPLRSLTMLLLLAFGVRVIATADAQTPNNMLALQQQALNAILNAADRICQTPPLEEINSKLQLNGTAKVEVNGVLKKLTDLGISGAASYENDKARGVAHAQLADAIAKGDDCKRDVLRELKAMIPGLAATASSTQKKHPPVTQNSISDFSATRVNNGQVMFLEVHTSYIGDHGDPTRVRFCAQQAGTSTCYTSRKAVSTGADKVEMDMPMSAGGFLGAAFDTMRPIDFQACFVVPIPSTNDEQAFGCHKFRYPTNDDPDEFLINH